MSAEEVKEGSVEAITAAKLLEDLKRENERILEEHKREIEAKYESQMQDFLRRLAPPPRDTGSVNGSPEVKQATNVLEALKGKRPIIRNPDDIDELTERFYNASQSPQHQNQPAIRIYEDDKPKQLIRASMETTKEEPVVVKKSEALNDSEFLATMASRGTQKKKTRKESKPLPVTLQNNPLSDRVAPPVWREVIDKKREKEEAMSAGQTKEAKAVKAAAKAEKDAAAAAEEEKRKHEEENKGGTDSVSVEEEEEPFNDDRFDDATKYMLKKTAFLINQSDEAIYGDVSGSGANAAKRKKKMRAAKKHARKDAVAMYGTVPEPNAAGTRGEVEGGGRDSPAPSRNVLVRSVEVSSPVMAAGGGGGGGMGPGGHNEEGEDNGIEEDLPYHPDYIEHVYKEDGSAHRVNDYNYEIDPHLALKKGDWENEIARHILSVYASDKSRENIKTSKAIMSMVDVDQKETNMDKVLEYIRNDEEGGKRESDGGEVDDGGDLDKASIAEMVAGGGSVAEEGMGEVDEVEEEDADSREATGSGGKSTLREGKKPGKGSSKGKSRTTKKKRPAKTLAEAQAEAEETDSVLTDEQRSSRQEMVTTAAEAGLTFKDEASFTNHSKYRSCITVTVGRTGNGPGVSEYNPGEVISIRGSPRVFPIWFVSSGEIYSNWARLPGGEELQAQLANLYEKRRFKEYLGIIEKIIDDLWRDRSLGKIDGIDAFLNPRHSTRKRVAMPAGVRLVGKDGKLLPREGGSGKGGAGRGKKDKEKTLNKFAPNEGTWGDENPNGNVWDDIAAHEQHQEKLAAELSDEELISLWGQLILTANAFGILCCEKKAYDIALEILNNAEKWSRRVDILPKDVRVGLTPHIMDAMAFYFYKRGKLLSAMSYTKMALRDHEELGNVDYVCISKLHQSAILSQSGEFKDAHKLLFEVLAMVEDGRMSMEEATPRQLCLVSIAYHNLAVVQLKLLVPDLAAKNSQNARKIARLCLSYSNRWMQVYEWTHEVAMEDIKFQLTHKPAVPLNQKQLAIIKELTTTMYDPLQA